MRFTDEEIDAVNLSKDQLDKLWEEIEPRLGHVSYPAALFERKFEVLCERELHQPRPVEPAKPLRDIVGHTREHGIETLAFAFRKPGRRRIHGIASTPAINSNNTARSSEGCTIRLPVPLLSRHSKYGRAIGAVTLVRRCPREIYVQAEIHENAAGDYAWQLIDRGELRCLSVGAADQHVLAEVDGIVFVDRWRLREVSICRRGANPDALFEVLR